MLFIRDEPASSWERSFLWSKLADVQYTPQLADLAQCVELLIGKRSRRKDILVDRWDSVPMPFHRRVLPVVTSIGIQVYPFMINIR